MLVQTDDALREWLAGAIKATGPYDPAAVFVGVAQAISYNGPRTTLADVTPATGKAGTRVPVVAWSAPYKLSDGRWVVDGPICKFVPLDETEAQSVTDYYLTDALVAGNLIAAGPLGQVFNLIDATRAVSLVPRLCMDDDADCGAIEVFEG